MAVYAEEPYILNRLARYIKLLEIDEELSQTGYKVTFAGEKKNKMIKIFISSAIRQFRINKPVPVEKLRKS